MEAGTTASSVAASASGAPTPSDSVSAAASASSAPTQGDGWAGDYTAKKASIELPEKSKDVTWKRDPGDKSVGPGKITILVADGVVHGEASGALGDQVVEGTFDGKLMRAALMPKNPSASDAMTGTAVGELSPTAISGTLRCVSSDAVMVREASFELKHSN